MDSKAVGQKYANELHTLAQRAGRALTQAADDVQVIFVDATNPRQSASELVESSDGVLILGGADVDPTLYSDNPSDIAAAKGVDRVADEFEISLARAARDAQVPLLGICRGLQVINVAFGGTLISDLGEGTVHNNHPENDEMTDHEVSIDEASRLSTSLNKTRIHIRSAHHQAIDQAGRGLVATAWSDDGIIEAVEAPEDYWTVAVQWHPEDEGAHTDDFMALNVAFVQASRHRRHGRQPD